MSEEIVRLHQPAAEVSADALRRAEEMIEREEGVQNRHRGWLAAVVTAVAVVMSLFHLYTAYAIVRPEHLRAIHIAFVLFLSFLIFPVAKRFRHRVMWWDWLLAAAGIATTVYLIAGGDDFFDRSIVPNDWDIVFGVMLALLILEAMRRSTGWILPFVTVCFLLYAFLGAYLPAPWTHKGYELPRLVGHMYMTLEGIYGTAIAVSSSLIILFTIFGAFLQFSGAGKFYIDFSFAVMGGKPSSAGRTVTLASFLLGGPSGSGVATTVTLGAVAAPMLAKVGYSKNEAGGLLAAGGLGAIISPPVLGAAAFLIAEFLKISYLDVVLMATIPTCLYYLALFIMVEIDVRKFGMKDALFEQVESAWSLTRKYWFHFLSLFSIVAFMLLGFSAELSVFWATVVALVTSFLHRDSALLSYDLLRGREAFPRGFADSGLVKALDGGSRAVLNVAATCAGAGLIVGVVTLTGLGLKFSSIVLAYAGNSLLLTAIYTALIVWIVGLAVPVTASYIICAVIAAPALIVLGVPDYAAHMFVFYYAVLSEVSPPTALSPFAAAAITGGDPYKTTLQCWKYTAPAFLVPFMFVLDPSGTGLLLTGSIKTLGNADWASIALVTMTAALGIATLAAGLQGWLFKRTTLPERAMLIAAGFLLVYPDAMYDLIGVLLIALAVLLQVLRRTADVSRAVRQGSISHGAIRARCRLAGSRIVPLSNGPHMAQVIGVPKEVFPGEKRVATVPDVVAKLAKLGFGVIVQSGAGEGASIGDEAYAAAGATIVADAPAVWSGADIIFKVRAPSTEEVEGMREGQVLVSFIWPAQNPQLLQGLAAKKATVLAMDSVPRISRAQKLDALSSMANIGGYRAVIEAAHHFGRFFTGQITAAGKVPPAKVFVIGAGVAGLAAIGAASGLGAIVRANDTRPEVADQIRSLGGEYVPVDYVEEGTGVGGYAKVMSEGFQKAQRDVFARQAKEVDIIITTALIPGKPAPKLITAEMVHSMKAGSVIVDMASEQGGNCELTEPGKVVTKHGVIIIGYTDLPSRLATQASTLYATNLFRLSEELCKAKDGVYNVDMADEVIRGTTVVKEGTVTWPPPAPKLSAAPPAVAKGAAAPIVVQKKGHGHGSGETMAAGKTAIMFAAAAALFLLIGAYAPAAFLGHFTVFVLAVFVGYMVVWNVTPALHTPLMSVTNAISSIIIIGALVQIAPPAIAAVAGEGVRPDEIIRWIAVVGIALTAINMFGGFAVTQRMLSMFRK